MSEITAHSFEKVILPQPLRRLLRGSLNYVQRLVRWPIIIWQVRGATWSDQWTLLTHPGNPPAMPG